MNQPTNYKKMFPEVLMEKVILIKGDKSNWYDQAIFIVKQNIPQSMVPVDFVSEAEKIIERYMHRRGNDAHIDITVPQTKKHPQAKPAKVKAVKKRNGFDIFLNAAMLIGCIALTMILAYSNFGLGRF